MNGLCYELGGAGGTTEEDQSRRAPAPLLTVYLDDDGKTVPN